MTLPPVSHLAGVYTITHAPTGKVYVGGTSDLQKRFKQHASLLNKNKHHCAILQSFYNFDGVESIVYRIIQYTKFFPGSEEALLIHKYRVSGADVLNATKRRNKVAVKKEYHVTLADLESTLSQLNLKKLSPAGRHALAKALRTFVPNIHPYFAQGES